MRRRRRPEATLDDVVEFLRGIGLVLMEIDDKLERVIDLLDKDGNGENA